MPREHLASAHLQHNPLETSTDLQLSEGHEDTWPRQGVGGGRLWKEHGGHALRCVVLLFQTLILFVQTQPYLGKKIHAFQLSPSQLWCLHFQTHLGCLNEQSNSRDKGLKWNACIARALGKHSRLLLSHWAHRRQKGADSGGGEFLSEHKEACMAAVSSRGAKWRHWKLIGNACRETRNN